MPVDVNRPFVHIGLDEQAHANYAGLLGRPVRGFVWSHVFKPHELSERRYQPEWGPWLVPAPDPDQSRRDGYDERRYPVFTDRRCHDLHRTFARVGRTPATRFQDEARRFANRFGFLDDARHVHLLQPSRKRPFASTDCPPGEPLGIWEQEAFECAALVALWDLVRAGDRGAVAKYVLVNERPRRVEVLLAWQSDRLTGKRRLSTEKSFDVDWRVVTYADADGRFVEADEVANAQTSRGVYRFAVFPSLARPRPDVLDAATIWLYDRINRKLWGRISPQLRFERSAAEALTFFPDSLLGAIYVYFAWELAGRSAAGTPCANPRCDRTIDPRWGRKYCDDRCRDQARYYRAPEKRRRSRSRATPATTPISTPTSTNDDGRSRTK